MSKLSNPIVVAAVVAIGWASSGSLAKAADTISIAWDGSSPLGAAGGTIKGSGPYTVTGSPIPIGNGSKVELTAVTTGVVTTISPLVVAVDPCTGLKTFRFNKSGLPVDTYDIKITVKYKDSNGVPQPDVTLSGRATARP